jgi:hypothetical protein
MTTDQSVQNEAELQANLKARIRAALPLLPARIQLERHLRLRLGHHDVIVNGVTSGRQEIRGRYDVLVLLDDAPLLLAELKDPGVPLTEDSTIQGLSYARAHNPIVPLVMLTNGRETLIKRSYLSSAMTSRGRMISSV